MGSFVRGVLVDRFVIELRLQVICYVALREFFLTSLYAIS